MSRTRRRLPRSFFRRVKTQATRIKENEAIESLKEIDAQIPNRLKARSRHCSEKLPNSWEDIHIAAYEELDYNNSMLFKLKEQT